MGSGLNDAISRQAAIDALDGEIEITGRTNAEAVKGYVRLVKDRLERLPSAQPEQRPFLCGHMEVQKGKMMTERKTVYLDDAIEAIRKLPNAGIHWLVSAEAVFDVLLKLPSAQPEQTKMIKEIRKWINSGNRGSADYFIVDKIEEIINKYER